jgi:hypothetical protein
MGLDQTYQVHKPSAAAPNAIQDAKKLYIDRFGKPAFERRLRDGVALRWVNIEGYSVPMSLDVDLEIVQGTLHITCGTTF